MKSSFMQAVALAALTSYSSADVVCKTNDATYEPDFDAQCNMPEWGILAILGDIEYDRHEVTADGYKLTLLRITSSSSSQFDDPADAGTNGPVLLHHGLGYDGHSWQRKNDQNELTIVEALFNAKYDVWVAYARGTIYSLGHDTFDSDQNDPEVPNGAAEYWDFGIDDAALIDIPAMINEILTTNIGEDSCQKVSLLTIDKGANYSLIAMNEFPTTASAVIQNVVNNIPCFIPNRSLFVNPTPAEETEQEAEESDDTHEHGHGHDFYYDYYNSRSWDRDAYAAAFTELRDELEYQEYRAFYIAYRAWERENYHDWWNNWEAGIQETLCFAVPSNERCQPEDQALVSQLFLKAKEIGLTRFYGPNWETDLEDLCGIYDPEAEFNIGCAFLRGQMTQFPLEQNSLLGTPQVPIGIYFHFAQQGLSQKWSKYNPDYATNGWFAEVEEYGVDQVNVPVSNIYISDDEICNDLVNQAIGDTIATQNVRVTYTDGLRTHDGRFNGIVGDNDASYVALILAMLGSGTANDALDCATLEVGAWE